MQEQEQRPTIVKKKYKLSLEFEVTTNPEKDDWFCESDPEIQNSQIAQVMEYLIWKKFESSEFPEINLMSSSFAGSES